MLLQCVINAIITPQNASLEQPGPLAHPVERFHGMEEVSGSSPLGSTNTKMSTLLCAIFCSWTLSNVPAHIAGGLEPAERCFGYS